MSVSTRVPLSTIIDPAHNAARLLLHNLIPRGLDNRVRQLFILGFMNEFGHTLVSIYLPLYLFTSLRASYLIVGLALTISTASSAFFQVIGGLLADSWGRRKAMLLSTGLRVPLLLILTIGSWMGISIVGFVALYAVSEALSGIFLTSSYAMVADVVETRRRTEAYAIQRIGTNLGFTLGAFIGGFLVAFTFSLAIWAVCILLAAVGVWRFIVESHRTASRSFRLRSVLSVAKDRTLLGYGVVSLAAGLVANQMGTTFVLYTTTHLSVNREQLGGLYTLNGVMIILLQYPLSRLVLRYRLSILLAIATFVRASGFLLVAAANQFYVLQIVIVALTVGEMLQAPSGSSYAASIASEDKRGEYLGFYNWAWNSGQALSPVVGGFLLGLLAPSEFGIWYIVFAVGASCSFVYVWLGKKARRVIPRLDNIL